MPFPREVLVVGGAMVGVWCCGAVRDSQHSHHGRDSFQSNHTVQGLMFRVTSLCKQEITKETNKNLYQED